MKINMHSLLHEDQYAFFYHTLLTSSYNEICFREIQTHFVFSTFFRKSFRLGNNVENSAQPDRPQTTICACALHPVYRRLQTHTHTHNM